MNDWLIILAQRPTDDGDGGWIKLLFGALVVIFWLISAVATWLNKKHEEARRQRLRDQLNQGAPEPGVRVQTSRERLPARVPPPPPMPRRFPQRAPKPPRQPDKRSRAVSAPPPVPVLEEVTEATTLPVTASEIAASSARSSTRPRAVSAESIAHWLRPATLRQQFILTEILQPPLALRPPRE